LTWTVTRGNDQLAGFLKVSQGAGVAANPKMSRAQIVQQRRLQLYISVSQGNLQGLPIGLQSLGVTP
jgi:hypothetical protein